MAERPLIVFIRHGETDWNVSGRLQGQRDIPLNATGRAQARRNGEAALAGVPGITGFDFVASPLGRARATMEIVRTVMKLDPRSYRTDDRLLEITFGDWEGELLDELRLTEPALVADRERNKWAFVPPKGESYEALSGRVRGWYETVDRPTVAVAHGGVGRVLCGIVAGLDPDTIVMMDFRQDRVLLIEGNSLRWI
jgi:broad specificity phosphatase PhoE